VNERLAKRRESFYHNKEKTCVFLSNPWTLEYAIARSNFCTDFQQVIVDSHYEDPGYKTKQLAIWSAITDEETLAVSMYSFIVDKKVSKSIIAQNFADYLSKNKSTASKKISVDDRFKYLVEAILHVTGGMKGWSLQI
jgi:putative ATP-dependent endonuclease of OLD family